VSKSAKHLFLALPGVAWRLGLYFTVVYTGHLLDGTLSGPSWLSGGAAGPEGSVVAFPVFAILLVLLWRVYRRRPSSRAPCLGEPAVQK